MTTQRPAAPPQATPMNPRAPHARPGGAAAAARQAPPSARPAPRPGTRDPAAHVHVSEYHEMQQNAMK